MSEDLMETVKSAVFNLLASREPNQGVMLYELAKGLPNEVTNAELENAINDLEQQQFATFEYLPGKPNSSRFMRGASFQKWQDQVNAA
jgi:hypothetical protein